MYIKQVELSHFKSFGGTVPVPLLEGFTVISGPNGSGKSNILDALLFALGLSSSKGMRADRLPDLVNQAYSSRSRSTVEATVSVTFDLSDLPEELFADDDELDSTSVETAVELLMQDQATDNGGIPGSNLNGNGHNGSSSGSQQTLQQPSPNSVHPAANGHLNPSGLQQNGQNQTQNHQTQNHRIQNHQTQNSEEANGSGPVADDIPLVPQTIPLREWTVTRRLRVTPQGTYTSSYLLNGESCTLTQLHEQLQRFRIYPEGYNVVLQGDVTSIISMNSRERRGIIDELAGVAAFDRRIEQAKGKLDTVQEREEKFRIVETELTEQRDRLAKDRQKAEKYQRLRTEYQTKNHWEAVLVWQGWQQQVQGLRDRLIRDQKKLVTLNQQRGELEQQIQVTAAELETLNAQVKALGEDEQLALQSTLATQEAELKQRQRQQQDLTKAIATTTQQLAQSQQVLQDQQQAIAHLQQQQIEQTHAVTRLTQESEVLNRDLATKREEADAIATASDVWVQEQAALRHDIDELLKIIDPLRSEQVRLQERITQLQQRHQTQTGDIEVMVADLAAQQQRHTQVEQQHQTAVEQVQRLAQTLAAAEQELQLQQDTQARLLEEERQKQRALDKLEAQTQAQQESQGTYATKVLLQMGLSGVCGLVAQLGRVDKPYQLALEIAAGGRLGFLVVEDDRVASAGIRVLKEQRAGRVTFLPLNKIRVPRVNKINPWQRPAGFIDYAVNLIDCDDKYKDVFAFVLGGTVVFESLNAARAHMGKFRIVTLEGELLETSGAMTGGSVSNRQGSLHFGRVEAGESAEAIALRERLQVITQILDRCEGAIAQATVTIKTTTDELTTTRQQQQELQFTLKQLTTQIAELGQNLEQGRSQATDDQRTLTELQQQAANLEQTLPPQEAALQQKRSRLNELEQSQTHSEWQQAQSEIRAFEQIVQSKQTERQQAEQQLQDCLNQQQVLGEKQQATQQRIQEHETQQQQQQQQSHNLTTQVAQLTLVILAKQEELAALEQRLVTEKTERDRTEQSLRQQQDQLQQTTWSIEKLQERYQTTVEEIATGQKKLEAAQAELPDPVPEIPDDLNLEELQKTLRSLQRRMESLEPVNMLALEEYERTNERLEELSDRLSTLDEERTELLLRIENFTTLRCRAFKEAFNAVNKNFQAIFAELSDGDGHLQLDDPKDPFNGGLNLVAHPKGKPVRRLASMSGGEKSLTALSFIFALQRYRPSPFYAFDEVDMFLDGANVERLAKMIRKQAEEAQFIVVSLRRPMIERADRTIGVTQARGAYTQVLGINLKQT
ncbi:MAG: chromosome segregation protein SMC [Cyanothece sp. SIO2G6]|nr:chromosome segregation protein SMC [Cyanothece sp. SIO2G6]